MVVHLETKIYHWHLFLHRRLHRHRPRRSHRRDQRRNWLQKIVSDVQRSRKLLGSNNNKIHQRSQRRRLPNQKLIILKIPKYLPLSRTIVAMIRVTAYPIPAITIITTKVVMVAILLLLQIPVIWRKQRLSRIIPVIFRVRQFQWPIDASKKFAVIMFTTIPVPTFMVALVMKWTLNTLVTWIDWSRTHFRWSDRPTTKSVRPS